MNAIYALVWFVALWKWGDWKNWEKYYPTILFFFLGDLLYQYFLSDLYPMWKYNPQGVDENIGLTHTHVFISIMLIKYPATILIYLSKFPSKRLKQLGWILLWLLIYLVNELGDRSLHLITYHNGWGFSWSILFNIVMFSLLKLHFHRPILTWLFSIVFIILLWNIFDVPTSVFR
ncbi:CBO0543 family protein [Bacillus suaedaesalsae]|uniref:Uncharacterized protein n=1 Tax=Bacillus suaedaesalsae TaxID=2810349 RepID=A0ABS2DD05_9BACI|nr:hypothetical protein [Bacillus suaedaesalsae]